MSYREYIQSVLLNSADSFQVNGGVEDEQQKLSIAWWNTSLNSYSKREKVISDFELRSAMALIYSLIEEYDIVVLGEYLDRHGIREFLREKNLKAARGVSSLYDVIDLAYDEDGHQFHNYLIYNAAKISYQEEPLRLQTENVIKGGHYRVFQCVRFNQALPGSSPLELFIVHWSMRDAFEGDLERRNKMDAASKLYERMVVQSDFPFKIVVGDFNSEPFEPPFLEMNSSRSETYALRTRGFYNPFWRFLKGDCGTLSSRGNESKHCDEPVFDSFVLNYMFLKPEYRFDVEPSILDTSKELFSRSHHRPIGLKIYQRNKKDEI